MCSIVVVACGADSVAAGRAAEERLAPAVTAGPATLEQVTATGASSTGEVHHAPTLTKEQWRVVFEGNNLTRGYIIGSNVTLKWGTLVAKRKCTCL